MSLVHERRHRRLLEHGGMAVKQVLRGGKDVDEVRGHDDVGQPERGKEHLAEGAHVDHPIVRVEPLERGERSPYVARLAMSLNGLPTFQINGHCRKSILALS